MTSPDTNIASAEAAEAKDAPVVVFVGLMCLLDNGSGAAINMRTILEMLAENGFRCHSITMSLFDGQSEYPRKRLFGPRWDLEKVRGKFGRHVENGVMHEIYMSESTQPNNLGQEDFQRLHGFLDRRLRELKPDIAIGYGSSNQTAQIFERVRTLTKRFVLDVPNPNITNPKIYGKDDIVLVPSEAQRKHILAQTGYDGRVFRTPIDRTRAVPPAECIAGAAPGQRRNGFVTFINPSPVKGGVLGLSIALEAARRGYDMQFLFVQGRWLREQWEENGIRTQLPNVWWLPNQPDMRPIYRRTSVLLFPSLWEEPAGRCIVEAQLSGIPVLATDRGGIPEQLNGGGFIFPVDPARGKKPGTRPEPAEVDAWLTRIETLMADDAAYAQASARALEAAAPFHPDVRTRDVAEAFRAMMQE